jgi:hypothetical protein
MSTPHSQAFPSRPQESHPKSRETRRSIKDVNLTTLVAARISIFSKEFQFLSGSLDTMRE